jgi:hypothetical protein
VTRSYLAPEVPQGLAIVGFVDNSRCNTAYRCAAIATSATDLHSFRQPRATGRPVTIWLAVSAREAPGRGSGRGGSRLRVGIAREWWVYWRQWIVGRFLYRRHMRLWRFPRTGGDWNRARIRKRARWVFARDVHALIAREHRSLRQTISMGGGKRVKRVASARSDPSRRGFTGCGRETTCG